MSKFIFDLLEKELAKLGVAALGGVQAEIENEATDHSKGFASGLLSAFGQIAATVADVRKTIEAGKNVIDAANAEVQPAAQE